MRKEFEKSIELAFALFDPNYPIRVQVFSFGWHKGRILAVGRNDARTHPLNLINRLVFRSGGIHYTKGRCAELNLFLRLKNMTNISFSKISVYNVRLDKNLQIKNSRPCFSCDSLLHYISPAAIFHTNETGGFEEYIS